MSHHWALIWTVKPGTEDQVVEIFSNYESPDRIIRDEEGNEQGKLLATQIYMKDNIVVRVMEIEGDLRQAAVHLGKQPQIQELEAKLDPLIETPRDMTTPEGARDFFMSTMMRCLVARKLED